MELEGIFKGIEGRFDFFNEVSIEYMDTRISRSELFYNQFHERMKEAYGGADAQLVFALDNAAFDYMRGPGKEVFPETPVVFCGVNNFEEKWLVGETLFAGVDEEQYGMLDAVNLAVETCPKSEGIFIISSRMSEVERLSENFDGKQYWRHLDPNGEATWAQVFEELEKIEVSTLIYLDVFEVNDNGERLDHRRLIDHLNSFGFPIFVSGERYMGVGALGGNFKNGIQSGRTAAEIGMRILAGERPSEIPVVSGLPNENRFDFRQMLRFGLSVGDVPSSAVIINGPSDFYLQYRFYFWAALVFIALQAVLIILLVVNMRRRKTAQISMEAEKDRAEAASQAKSEFLAIMSHEFRTPLNAILGFSQIMRLGDPDEKRSKYAEVIQSNGKQLLYLVDNLLNYTYYSKGKITSTASTCDLASELELLVDSFGAKTEYSAVSLELKSTDLPKTLRIDWPKTREIISNLVENALKFSSQGMVTIEIMVRNPEASRRELFCRINDEGPGISESDLESIFEPFTQVDTSMTRGHSGMGLGLAICSRLVEAMGGKIECSSKLGEGTTFEVTLPLERNATAPNEVDRD